MRSTKPYKEIEEKLGNAISLFETLVVKLRYHYELDEIWAAGNPNHKYHSSLTFKKGGKSLIILALREKYFTACVVLGKDEREKFDEDRASFSKEVCILYDNTEVYHDGKWLSFDINEKSTSLLVDDIFKLVQLKAKPNRKNLPANLAMCGKLDIGLSKKEITDIILV